MTTLMTAPAPTRFAPVTPLHVVPPLEEIDLAGAERAAADFLNALGVATDTPAVRATSAIFTGCTYSTTGS